MRSSKKCFKCKSVKELAEFYRHPRMADGHLNKCKECAKNDVALHRAANLEKVREYDRVRAKDKDRRKAAAISVRRWRAEDRRRSAAHRAVARAVRAGTLSARPCETCGNDKSVAHHDDYDKPLDVRWLCPPCHRQHHAAQAQKAVDNPLDAHHSVG